MGPRWAPERPGRGTADHAGGLLGHDPSPRAGGSVQPGLSGDQTHQWRLNKRYPSPARPRRSSVHRPSRTVQARSLMEDLLTVPVKVLAGSSLSTLWKEYHTHDRRGQ